MPMPLIRARVGHLQGSTFPLGDQQVVIGRDPSSDIALNPESAASRRHAAVFQQDGRWRIQDLGSVNGIRINGQYCRVHQLAAGDTIELADYTLTCIESNTGRVT